MNLTEYGAKSDLAAWESRPVALAITACPVPVWTALGHATDHTLADSLANACHPTPSAAAAAIIVGRAEAAVRAAEEQAQRHRHAEELASSRARARRAVLVAVLVAVVAILMVASLL
ncbi:MAG: exodeoxyribonuclease VII large subunit [Acidimicrobiales bacterium]